MSAQRTAKVPEDIDDRLSQLEDDYDLNSTDAQIRALEEGLRSMGYHPTGSNPETRLRYALRQASMVIGLSGFVFIGLALFSSLQFRFIGFGLVVAGLTLQLVERIICRYEPGVSASLGLWTDAKEIR